MSRRFARVRDEKVPAWAWEIFNESTGRWQLCYWAEPSRTRLLDRFERPSPEARPVRVVITRDREQPRKRT